LAPLKARFKKDYLLKGLDEASPIEIQKNTNKWEIINWFSYFKYDNGDNHFG